MIDKKVEFELIYASYTNPQYEEDGCFILDFSRNDKLLTKLYKDSFIEQKEYGQQFFEKYRSLNYLDIIGENIELPAIVKIGGKHKNMKLIIFDLSSIFIKSEIKLSPQQTLFIIWMAVKM